MKDKNGLENTIELGKPSIFLFFKFSFMLLISSFPIFDPLYSIVSEAKGKTFNFTPSYNTLIKGK